MKSKHLIWTYICACFYYLLCAVFVVYPCYYRYIKLKERNLAIARITIPRTFIIAIMDFINKLGSLIVFHIIILGVVSLIIFIFMHSFSKKIPIIFLAFFMLLTSLFALFCFDYFIAVIWCGIKLMVSKISFF